MTKKTVYLPGLNGIRAIASIAVVFSHITISLKDFGLNPYILGTQDNGSPRSLDLAGYGVSMFFALSGFLITFLLCKEKEVVQVNIKKFYFRRILRIWPLYYGYFIICIIVYMLFNIEYSNESILFYLFYSANVPFVLGSTLPFLAHFWSLGVEEQFYIFWPWLNKMKLNRLIWVTSLGVILLIGLKSLLHFFVPNTTVELFINVTRFHCMMIGALGAIAYYLNFTPIIKIATNKIVQSICWFIIFLVLINRFHIASFLDNEILTMVTTFIILGQVSMSGPISLENRYFDFFGKISYGVYVMHPVLIFLSSKVLKNITSFDLLNYIIVYIVIFGTTILLSYLSYKYFESKFLKIKEKRFSVVKSSATNNYA
jgi:peptidoglycan/LPS O-acetylase OafA/YrhL